MPKADTDLLILGAGCAGLALARRLAGSGIETTVLDPRETWEDDRVWSFWRSADRPLPGLGGAVAGRWRRWRLDAPAGESVVRRSDRLVYESVSAGRYYAGALDRLADDPAVALHRLRAGAPRRRADGLWGCTTDVGSITARRVVDTRPPATRPAFAQTFAGAEIETEDAVFDAETVGLMSFREGPADAVDFVYTLPFAPDRALVEVTRFATHAPDPAGLTSWLDREINTATRGGRHTVRRREAGVLPMQVGHAAPAPPGSLARLGLGGGAARPSTGYAFQRIQAGAERLACQLHAGDRLALPDDGATTRFMDALFLRVLARAPARGPALFLSLFRRAPRDRVERFLSGSVRPDDRLSVMASLPPAPFLRALVA